ncbi:hypothetical protein [Argonema galeatum]|uniref:hypothetical protein n=1 Tax=Argonema galeatum TaxID=2942762 RepID=UPI00201327E2|nr:hypothetical protein [Argonema galeatum]MCL1469025.1 hypothetical protein [Argonema galeatum A003/A1]
MTLEIHHLEGKQLVWSEDEASLCCSWNSNEGDCDDPALPGKQYCSYHLGIVEFMQDNE